MSIESLKEKARGHEQREEWAKALDLYQKAIDQLEKARSNLFPDGHPQERMLNVYQYLVRFGPELLTAVAERIHRTPRDRSAQIFAR